MQLILFFQDGAEKEDRPAILKETIHNLARSTQTGSLWFIDNESSFLSAYSILYGESAARPSKFLGFHKRMLETTCVFRRKTISRLFAMHKSADPAGLLLRFVGDNEPLFAGLPKIHANAAFSEHFPERLNQVWKWVRQCQHEANYTL